MVIFLFMFFGISTLFSGGEAKASASDVSCGSRLDHPIQKVVGLTSTVNDVLKLAQGELKRSVSETSLSDIKVFDSYEYSTAEQLTNLNWKEDDTTSESRRIYWPNYEGNGEGLLIDMYSDGTADIRQGKGSEWPYRNKRQLILYHEEMAPERVIVIKNRIVYNCNKEVLDCKKHGSWIDVVKKKILVAYPGKKYDETGLAKDEKTVLAQRKKLEKSYGNIFSSNGRIAFDQRSGGYKIPKREGINLYPDIGSKPNERITPRVQPRERKPEFNIPSGSFDDRGVNLNAGSGSKSVRDFKTASINTNDKSVVGEDRMAHILELPKDSAQLVNARAVARLGHRCTGFVIADDLIMTNHHCLNRSSWSAGDDFTFPFDAQGNVNPHQVHCKAIAADDGLDYAVFKCSKKLGDTYGVLDLEKRRPQKGDPLYLIARPGYTPDNNGNKVYNGSTMYSQGVVTHNNIQMDDDAGTVIEGTHNNFGGTSGGPTMSRNSHKVVSLNNRGGWGSYHSYSIPMSNIIPHLQRNYPNIHSSLGGKLPKNLRKTYGVELNSESNYATR